MSWLSWLLVLAGLYLVVFLVRAVIQFVAWFIEEYITEPRELRRLKEYRANRIHDEQKPPAAAPATHKRDVDHSGDKERKIHRAPFAVPSHKPSSLGRLMKSLKMAVVWKGYDYWVAAALAEEDLDLKIKYLAKALKLNPTYSSAWGLQGTALFDAKRYEEDEGMRCFDRSLELHPSALMWYKKGLGCRYLERCEEAIRCFDKAMEAKPDHKLLEDASRMKKVVEDELQSRATKMTHSDGPLLRITVFSFCSWKGSSCFRPPPRPWRHRRPSLFALQRRGDSRRPS